MSKEYDVMTTTTSTFIKALESATQTDLDAIKTEIDELEKQLEKRRAQKRMVEILLGVVPPRGKSGPKKKAAASDDGDEDDDDDGTATPATNGRRSVPTSELPAYDKRLRIAKMLLGGPRREAEIQEELKLPAQGFQSTIGHPWFARQTDGTIRVTTEGRAAATGKPQVA